MIRGLMSSWLLLSVAKSGVNITAESSTFSLLHNHYSHFLNTVFSPAHADNNKPLAVTVHYLKADISSCHRLWWAERTVPGMELYYPQHMLQCPHGERTTRCGEHPPAPWNVVELWRNTSACRTSCPLLAPKKAASQGLYLRGTFHLVTYSRKSSVDTLDASAPLAMGEEEMVEAPIK